jgi:hypothetical protein
MMPMKPILLAAAAALAATAGFAAPAAAREVRQASDLYEFTYVYPPALAVYPPLRARLDADLARQLAKLKADARVGQAEARANGFPYRPYAWDQSWQIVTDLPGWLSLSASYWTFTGGAHGNSWFGAMLYDKRARLPRDPLTLFASKQALSRAIRAPFCAALNRQRAQKRGEPVKPGSTALFEDCIDPVGQTILLGSRGHKGFDRIGVLVAPYEAGPYAEGSYEVTVPVTPAVLGAVRREYRAAFALPKES